MFGLRTVCFLVILNLFVCPICGETKPNDENVTESSVKSSLKVENDATTKREKLLKPAVISEGGPVAPENKTAKVEPSASTPIVKPVIENVSQEKIGKEVELETSSTKIYNITKDVNATTIAHNTVPKKGVSVNDTTRKIDSVISTTTEKSTTVNVKLKKPTVTVGSNEESEMDQKGKNSSTEKVPTIEYYQRHKEQINKADFVIPIIAVILSVPIVAIVINILYKRSKEWWSHRHYRRMDFLIDGMYNN